MDEGTVLYVPCLIGTKNKEKSVSEREERGGVLRSVINRYVTREGVCRLKNGHHFVARHWVGGGWVGWLRKAFFSITYVLFECSPNTKTSSNIMIN